MPELLVVGSVALDSVATPFGAVREALGGSATFFSYSASFFTPVRLLATVGEDFPRQHLDLLRGHGVDEVDSDDADNVATGKNRDVGETGSPGQVEGRKDWESGRQPSA